MNGRNFKLHLFNLGGWTPNLCEDGKLHDISSILILVKSEGLGYLPSFNLQKTEGFEILSFPIMLNTEGPSRGIEGYNLSNIDVLALVLTFSPSPSPVRILNRPLFSWSEPLEEARSRGALVNLLCFTHESPLLVTLFNVLTFEWLAGMGPPWVTFRMFSSLDGLPIWVRLSWLSWIWRCRSHRRSHQLDKNAMWFECGGCRLKEDYYVVVNTNVNACIANKEDEGMLLFLSCRRMPASPTQMTRPPCCSHLVGGCR